MKKPIPSLPFLRPGRATVAATLTASVVALLAMASRPALADGGPPCAHHGPAMTPAAHLDRLTPILGLTADQQAAAKKLAQEAEARFEPLTRQAGTQHDEIRALLESARPDAAQIGRKVIAMHATHVRLQALHQQEMGRFEALLTADQRARLAKLHADRAGMHGPHGHPGRWHHDAADGHAGQ